MIGQVFVKRIIRRFFTQKEMDENDTEISELEKKLSKDKANLKGLGEEE